MAKIVRYQSGETINAPSMANTQVRDPRNEAVQQLGAQIETAADRFAEQQNKKQDFKAENDYRKLQLTLGNELDTRADQMPEDGTGFHDGFRKDVYAPARDQFLSNIPERLREKYGTILGDDGADTEAWSIKAATRERDQLYKWYDNQLKVGQEELATAISLDPDGYDKTLQSGLDAIEASGLPTDQKETQRQNWTKMAQVSHLNKMLETKPEVVLRDLGADPSMLSPTTQFGMLKKAVTQTESGGNPNAISKKGAIGLMQVMPGTAKDISKWMGDGLLDAGMSDARVTEIMSNPVLNERYGDFYLKKMIKEYSGKGGIEAALVGYNAGPGVAQKWIESGFDASVLPAETRGYVKKVMGQLPSMAADKMVDAGKGDPNGVTLEFNRKGMAALSKQDESALNPDLTNRVKTAFAGIGINKLRVTSGFRSEAENKRVGGAKKSQHQHGNAMDIDVSGYSTQERVNIIKSLSASGITGLGVGGNIIHADLGGRRAWGYARSDGGGAVPKWAEGAIADHLANTAQAPSRVGLGGRYAGLPYDARQKFIHAADTALTQQTTAANKATALQRVELQTAMRNELASISTSGQSTSLVDDTAVSTVLGEDDYVKWVQQRETAQRTFTARDGVGGMTLQEMDDRLKEYEPDPGSPTFADDQRVQAAVEKEIDRVTKLRYREPTEGAMQFPDVKAQWDKVSSADEPAPADVQEFVRLNLERQKEFGIKPGSEQPVPKPWAVAIGQQLSKIPETSGKNRSDVSAAIVVMYDSLQKTFGDYTDEVIISALKEYRGVGTNTAELLTGYMEAIQSGGDPIGKLRSQKDRAVDADQVEQSRGFFGTVWDFIQGEETPIEAVADDTPIDGAADVEVNPDMTLRAKTAIENLGDEMTPEQEASLVRRFGQTAVNAAKATNGE